MSEVTPISSEVSKSKDQPIMLTIDQHTQLLKKVQEKAEEEVLAISLESEKASRAAREAALARIKQVTEEATANVEVAAKESAEQQKAAQAAFESIDEYANKLKKSEQLRADLKGRVAELEANVQKLQQDRDAKVKELEAKIADLPALVRELQDEIFQRNSILKEYMSDHCIRNDKMIPCECPICLTARKMTEIDKRAPKEGEPE